VAAEAVVAVAAEVVEVAAPEEPSVMVSELPLLVVSVVVLPEVPVLEVLPEEWFLSQVSGGQLAVVVPVEVVVAAEVPVGEARGVVLATTLITDLVVITDTTVGIGRTGAILTGTHGITGGTIPPYYYNTPYYLDFDDPCDDNALDDYKACIDAGTNKEECQTKLEGALDVCYASD